MKKKTVDTKVSKTAKPAKRKYTRRPQIVETKKDERIKELNDRIEFLLNLQEEHKNIDFQAIISKDKPAKRKYTRRPQPEKNKIKIDPDDFYLRLSERHGNLLITAKYYNISRVTLWHYIKDNPALEKIVKDVRETTVDVVESTMMKEILGIPLFDGEGSDKKQIGWMKEPNTTLMIFWLKTQAKHRGYTERQEVVNIDGPKFGDLPSLDDVM